MPKSVAFDPNGTFVASKSRKLILASREYQLGDTIDKSGISRRKLAQLWSLGRISYSWMVEQDTIQAEAPTAMPETSIEVATSTVEEDKPRENLPLRSRRKRGSKK